VGRRMELMKTEVMMMTMMRRRRVRRKVGG